jgi:hypothetical protein
MRERRHRGGRADQHVAVVEEGEEALVDLGLLDVGPGDVGERVLEAALGIVDDVLVEQVAMLFEPLAVLGHEDEAAHDLEHVVHVCEVGMRVRRFGEDRLEGPRALVEHRRDVGIDRAAAEIGREGSADRAQVHIAEALGDVLAVGTGKRIDLVAVCHRAKLQVQVRDRSAHRPENGEGRERHRPLGRNETGRRSQAGDAAERRRRPAASAVIRAGGDRNLADGERSRAATGRSGRRLLRIERVAGRAVHAVARVCAGAELGRVGLADDDAALKPQPRDHRRVLGRHVILVDQAAVGGAQLLGVLQVLHPDGQAMQEAQILAAHDGVLGVSRRFARALLVQRHHRVDRAVGGADALQAAIEQLDRRHLLLADQAPQLDGRDVAEFSHGRYPVLVSPRSQ